MTLRIHLKCTPRTIATLAFAMLSATAHADCQRLLAGESGHRAETGLAFPSQAAENEFRGTLEKQAGLNLSEAKTFFDCLKVATKHDDTDTLSELVRYPLAQTPKKRSSIRTPAAFKKAYSSIFNAKVKHAIEAQRFEDLFVSYRGLMIGNGEVWISGIVEPTSGKTAIKIIAINNQ